MYNPNGAPYRSTPRRDKTASVSWRWHNRTPPPVELPNQYRWQHWDHEWLIVKDDTHGPFDWLSPGGVCARWLLFVPYYMRNSDYMRCYMRCYSDPLTAARNLVWQLNSNGYRWR